MLSRTSGLAQPALVPIWRFASQPSLSESPLEAEPKNLWSDSNIRIPFFNEPSRECRNQRPSAEYELIALNLRSRRERRQGAANIDSSSNRGVEEYEPDHAKYHHGETDADHHKHEYRWTWFGLSRFPRRFDDPILIFRCHASSPCD
jgi:hypothetical protein